MDNYFNTDEYKNHINHSELKKLISRKKWTSRIVYICFIPIYIIAFIGIGSLTLNESSKNILRFFVFIGVSLILNLIDKYIDNEYQPFFDAEKKEHEAREAKCKEARQKELEESQLKAKIEVDADVKRVLG